MSAMLLPLAMNTMNIIRYLIRWNWGFGQLGYDTHAVLDQHTFYFPYLRIKASKYPSNTFAESIRKHRLLQGLSQKELGEKLGVSESTVYNWEHEKCEPKNQDLNVLYNTRL
jgi:hypothetical protein